jgi:hypothetical protein
VRCCGMLCRRTLCEILMSTDGPVGDWRPAGTTTPWESMSSILHCLLHLSGSPASWHG